MATMAFGFYALADERSEKNVLQKSEHHKVLVVGGGSGGIAVAAQLNRKLPSNPDIAILEPSSKHYYQPLWTLVGAGVYPKEKSQGEEKKYIPKGAHWIQDSVKEFVPSENYVVTESGKTIKYDYMIVATGVRIDLDSIKGLRESMGKDGVCTNYSYDFVSKTWDFFKSFKGGVGVFTYPDTAVKCGGAPMKIMWLFDDFLRKAGIREKSQVIFCTPGTSMFGVKKYSDVLEKMKEERNVDAKFKHSLIEVRGATKEAVFKGPTGNEVVIKYDLLHVTPPMGPIPAVKKSEFVAENGYVDVDKFTLQHKKFKNVFSLGDTANLPTSKTIAAITRQAPVLVRNLTDVMNGKPATAKYDGYTSCPIVTSYKDLILAEFLYDGVVKETFPFDQSKPRRSMYFLKKHVFPNAYWGLFLKGRWFGPSHFFPPDF